MTNATLIDWYRDVPYQSFPFPCTHPDSLYVAALLAGLKAADPRTARVLEIGCASGGNLLPMCQTLPDARFVGIDLSSVQIERASDLAKRAGLLNVNFQCVDLLEFSDQAPFDYIIAHGVYSWVSAAARQHLLRLCGTLLTPDGVTCVSYNTYPGWHVRGMLREAMLMAGEGLPPPERASHARQVADSLARTAKLADTTWGALVQLAADAIRSRSDDQLLHDDLEPINQPVYFREFMEQASECSLRYLGTADPALEPGSGLPKAILAEISKLTHDPLKREQYLDRVLNRSYRESVLCRADANVQTRNMTAVVQTLWLASSMKPVGALQFQSSMGTVRVTHADTGKALKKLYHAWPGGIHFNELGMEQPEAVANEVLPLFSRGWIEFWGRPCDFAGARNRVSPLARLQAAEGGPVTNLRHKALQFDADIMNAIAGEAENRTESQINLLTWHSLMLG